MIEFLLGFYCGANVIIATWFAFDHAMLTKWEVKHHLSVLALLVAGLFVVLAIIARALLFEDD